jgi:hypothetical protein
MSSSSTDKILERCKVGEAKIKNTVAFTVAHMTLLDECEIEGVYPDLGMLEFKATAKAKLVEKFGADGWHVSPFNGAYEKTVSGIRLIILKPSSRTLAGPVSEEEMRKAD